MKDKSINYCNRKKDNNLIYKFFNREINNTTESFQIYYILSLFFIFHIVLLFPTFLTMFQLCEALFTTSPVKILFFL